MRTHALIAIPFVSLTFGCVDEHTGVDRLTARVAALEARVASLTPHAPVVADPKPIAEPKPPYQAPEPGWSLSGGGRDAYQVFLDTAVAREGHPTVHLFPLGPTRDKYGTWARGADASKYVGKHVRFTIQTKTHGTTERADFWARVQAPDSPGDGFGLGGHWTYLPAESDWTRREIVLDVPPDADRFNYGVGISGPGEMWFDAPNMEIVGPEVPVTPMFDGEQKIGDWVMTGVGAPDYEITQDDKAIRLERNAGSDSQKYVHLLRVVPADKLVGKKVKATFDVRVEGLESAGACVLKAQKGRDLAYQGFLASDSKPVAVDAKGEVHCAMEAEIPAGTKWVLYGYALHGGGKAWVRGGSVK